MNFNIGEHVVYCSKEICLIESIVKRSFDGINEIDYFRLIPINTNKSAYYIPCENCDAKIRPVLSKEEIYSLIDDMPTTESEWCDDRNTRKNIFHSVLKSDDYHKLISMVRSLYLHRESQKEKGKKLLAADAKAMNEAEHLIFQEIAFVFGIKEDEVSAFIDKRLNK